MVNGNMQPNTHSSMNVSFGMVVLLFLFAHVGLSALGLVPSEVSEFNQKLISSVRNLETLSYEGARRPILPRSAVASSQKESVIGEEPTRITIPKIDVAAAIKTPERADVDVLDEALKEGVVHDPGSGGIGGDRRMFLFGHSSRLPVVQNEAYRSFNGLDKLSVGDEVTVSASSSVTYRVTSVEVVDKDEALVSFISGEGELTLSTCTTFGTRENRVVVKAEIVDEASEK